MHTPIIRKERQICCTKRKSTLHTTIKLMLNSQIIWFYLNCFKEITERSISRITLLLQYSILFTITIRCIKHQLRHPLFKHMIAYNHCGWLLCCVCIQFLIWQKSQTLSITLSMMNLQLHHFYLFDTFWCCSITPLVDCCLNLYWHVLFCTIKHHNFMNMLLMTK